VTKVFRFSEIKRDEEKLFWREEFGSWEFEEQINNTIP
jgi:hypothetical protein